MFSAFDAPYHILCNKIAAEANVIVVYVEYGLCGDSAPLRMVVA